MKKNNIRICSECKCEMSEGYILFDGEEYYCCDACLYENYTKAESDELYDSCELYWTKFN